MNRLAVLITSFAFALPLLAGCVDPDPDGDLLLTEFEEIIGTDPENADTDGDGFDDGLEYVNYFSPTKDDDYPYTNSDYPRNPLPSSSAWQALKDEADEDQGRGWEAGEFSKSFDAVDQYGDRLMVKRFFGEVIVIDVSAEWCPPCRAAALQQEAEWQEYREDGVMFLTVVGDGLNDGDANVDRWLAWPTNEYEGDSHPYGDVSQYGGEPGDPLTVATFEDGPDDETAQEISQTFISQTGGWPTYVVIGRDHTIQYLDAGFNQNLMTEVVEDLIDEERPEIDYLLPENVEEIRAELN
ncbi:MAG: redoxin domain-containing protein [Myxococcota bacterium]|nr:redoxin domain-containing protein [Myxococcota bacterium]